MLRPLAVVLALTAVACAEPAREGLRAGGSPAASTPAASSATGSPSSPAATPPPATPAGSVPPSSPAATTAAPASPVSSPASGPAGPPRRDPKQRYEVTTTVLESPEHGPELCVGGMADSYPPQCGGVPVEPFSWADVAGEESANGTTWGQARFVGTFDGRVLQLTERPSRPRPPSPPPPNAETFPTSCQEPAGGWVADRSKAGHEHLDAAVAYANAQRDVAAVWLSYPGGRPSGEYDQPGESVLNLAFTGDLDRHRRAARERWGGGLCVTSMPRPRSALSRVQDELHDARRAAERAGVHVYGSAVDEVRNVVTASVLVADAVSRHWVDERFGPGWVELDGIFRPVR